MSDTKEYKVILKKGQNLDDFYSDLEGSSSIDNIPDRKVEVALRRPISRATNYYLTEDEVEKLRNDPRVEHIDVPLDQREGKYELNWNQTATFTKDPAYYRNSTANYSAGKKQWGLPRVIKGSNYTVKDYSDEFSPGVPGGANDTKWGKSANSSVGGEHELLNETISTTSSGKHVDVVITDEFINPNHPEFWTEVNPTTKPDVFDGTQTEIAGSRVKLFNWYQYSSVLGYNTPNDYPYFDSNGALNYSDDGSNNQGGYNHGTHVAATVAGNTQGWARDANIYYMCFLSTDSVADWTEKMFDYIRYWHKNKPINPETGRRNPTIVNASWGSNFWIYWPRSESFSAYTFRAIKYRTNAEVDLDALSDTGSRSFAVHNALEANGYNNWEFDFQSNGDTFARCVCPWKDTAMNNEIQDLTDDGVLFISSAGNHGFHMDISGGEDYDNYVKLTLNGAYAGAIRPWRGQSPGTCPTAICVGNVSNTIYNGNEEWNARNYNSNFGERVDIWAPGTMIQSAVAAYQAYPVTYYWQTVQHSRTDKFGAVYYDGAVSGTSMSSPQVCGVLACLLEQEPDMTQAEALQHLIETSTPTVGTGIAASPWTDPYRNLGFPSDNHSDSNNRFLRYIKKRPEIGQVYPHSNHKNRKTADSGVKYPRTRTRVTNPVPS